MRTKKVEAASKIEAQSLTFKVTNLRVLFFSRSNLSPEGGAGGVDRFEREHQQMKNFSDLTNRAGVQRNGVCSEYFEFEQT